MKTTIIYYTDNNLPEPLFTKCQQYLEKAADGKPIVSVSHKPISLGENICIGEQKSCWLLLYKQVLLGVQRATTPYVAMAEHDCFYTKEHFNWIPPDDTTFYYNENVWFAEWGGNLPELNGMYSKWPHQRLALSQLICNRDLLEQCLTERIGLLDKDPAMIRKIVFAGEPGLSKMRLDRRARRMLANLDKANHYATNGSSVYLKQYIQEQLDKEQYGVFNNKLPNLDVRHDRNFTGPRRGHKRRYELHPWGRFDKIMENG